MQLRKQMHSKSDSLPRSAVAQLHCGWPVSFRGMEDLLEFKSGSGVRIQSQLATAIGSADSKANACTNEGAYTCSCMHAHAHACIGKCTST